MTNRSIVPYRNSAIGGRPATSSDFIPRSSSSYQHHNHNQYPAEMNNSNQNKQNYYSYQHPQQHQNQSVHQRMNGNSAGGNNKVYQSSQWKQSNNSSSSSANANNRFSSPIQQQHNHGQIDGNNGYNNMPQHSMQNQQHFSHNGQLQHQGSIAGFPAEMFQPKTTTFIRKLDPSEVFGEGSEINDFDFGGLILDSNNVIIQPPIQHSSNNNNKGGFGQSTSSCKAIVPFKADSDMSNEGKFQSKAYQNQGKRSVVKLISPDQADDDFHFSPEDFENGQTTYFPASALIQQFGPIKSGPFKSEKSDCIMINGNYVPSQNPQMQHQSFAAANGVSYANRIRSQSLDRKFTNPTRRQSMTHGGGASPEYPNNNNFGYSNIHYEINNTGKVLEPSHSCGDVLDEEESDNRTTYGFAEFQAARQRFENNCKHNQSNSYQSNGNNNSNQKKLTSGYRGSIANPYNIPYEDPAIPLTNRSTFCSQTACNHAQGPMPVIPGSITTQPKDLDDVNAIQQYVVAEEGGPGGRTKIFSFPAGEAPGDMTLLRAAVAANQPEDPYILEDFQEDGQEEIQMQKGLPNNPMQIMRTQQSFPANNQMFSYGQPDFQMNPANNNGGSGNKKNPRHRNSIAISQGNFCMTPSQNHIQGSFTSNTTSGNNMIPMQQPFPNMHQMVMPTSGVNSNLTGFGCKSMSPMMNTVNTVGSNNNGMFMNTYQGQGPQQHTNNSPYYSQTHECNPYNNTPSNNNNNHADMRGHAGVFGNPSYLTQSKNLI